MVGGQGASLGNWRRAHCPAIGDAGASLKNHPALGTPNQEDPRKHRWSEPDPATSGVMTSDVLNLSQFGIGGQKALG